MYRTLRAQTLRPVGRTDPKDGGFFVYKIKEMVSGAGDWKICEVYMCGLSEEVPESFQELLGWSSLSFVDMGKEAVFCKPEEEGSK